jgi:hypothetical protein
VSCSFRFTRSGLHNDEDLLLPVYALEVHDPGADEFNKAATAAQVSALAQGSRSRGSHDSLFSSSGKWRPPERQMNFLIDIFSKHDAGRMTSEQCPIREMIIRHAE